jgi:hypothetical protein
MIQLLAQKTAEANTGQGFNRQFRRFWQSSIAQTHFFPQA